MLKKYHLFLPMFIFFAVFSSCKNDSLDNFSKRNANYVWFVEAGSDKGEWIELDFDQNNNYLSNGSCTFFYKNGQKREFVVYDENSDFDTTFYYNLDEKLTHYTYRIEEDYKNRIVDDGYFEAFAADESLVLSGTAVNSELRDSTWHGDVKGLIKIMDYTKLGHDLSDDVFRELTNYLKNGDKSSKVIINNQIDRIDSIRAFKLNFVDGFAILLNQTKVSSSLDEVKQKSLKYLKVVKEVHEKEFPQMLQYLKDEDEENARDIAIGFYQDLNIADERTDEVIISFTRNFQLDGFFIIYAFKPD